jgi:hypothetical protein
LIKKAVGEAMQQFGTNPPSTTQPTPIPPVPGGIPALPGEVKKGNIVSQAAHQAKAEGLKGVDLADRVHEAIDQRKLERIPNYELREKIE